MDLSIADKIGAILLSKLVFDGNILSNLSDYGDK